MSTYGYEIKAVLVTDIDPDRKVKEAMNDINVFSRLREAAFEKAEGDKILQVKSAEADSESKFLSGKGVAKQRKALIDGLRETVQEFSSSVAGSKPQDVMDLLLLTQYFDMVRDIGHNSKQTTTLFMPHGPHSVRALRDELSTSFQITDATGGAGGRR